jgi:Xaa-Pro dipeptidase
MFGVKEPDFYGVVEVSTAKAMLFMPRLPEDFAIWIGRLLSQDEFKKMYSVDEVHYVDDVSRTVHIMHKLKSLMLSWPSIVDLKCD